MTRTTDEVVKPLPGQMAFRFMAEPGPDDRFEPEQEGPAIVPSGAAAMPARRGKSLKNRLRSRRPGSAWGDDAVGAD